MPICSRVLPVCWVVVLAAFALAAAASEPLSIRVNDADARPGELAVVVLRTYAPRPVAQGQLCLRARRPARGAGPAQPVAALEEVRVWSGAGDAVASAKLETGPGGDQLIMLELQSPSGSLNESDGPLAALFLRLAGDVVAGDRYDLELDVANTAVFDNQGRKVSIRPRHGELRILEANAPFELEAEADPASPGQMALLEVTTRQSLPLLHATFALHYDPALAAGLPTATVLPQFGGASVTVAHAPGVVTIDVVSSDSSFNEVPGGIVSVHLPLRSDLVPILVSPIALDPATTAAWDAGNQPLALELEGNDLVVRPTSLFADDFETGDLACWF